jgi:hypothetical protein
MNHTVITEAMHTAIKVLRSSHWWTFEALNDHMDVEFEGLQGDWDGVIFELDNDRRMPSGIR